MFRTTGFFYDRWAMGSHPCAGLSQWALKSAPNAMVTNMDAVLVSIGKERISAALILWGVGVLTDRTGRVIVQPDLTVSGPS